MVWGRKPKPLFAFAFSLFAIVNMTRGSESGPSWPGEDLSGQRRGQRKLFYPLMTWRGLITSHVILGPFIHHTGRKIV
ncbi:uncharacterized protein B0T15DRAFT_535965, partial [Chaetomium strumarium]